MYYTDQKSAQIVLSLFKKHSIKNIVVSPGAKNIPIVGSIQADPFFTVYSAVDERSAGYMAVGLACETGEIVVISCTGATASRNYLSALTEAYYRKLPIIALTSCHGKESIGHLIAQSIDRSKIQNDISRLSVEIPPIRDKDEEWEATISTNKAILETRRHGGGPVHINIKTTSSTFKTKELPDVVKISRYFSKDNYPEIDPRNRTVVFIGSCNLSFKDQEAIEQFVKTHNAVVLCDHTSGYHRKGKVQASIIASSKLNSLKPDLILHIGEVSGDYPTIGIIKNFQVPVWRISEDGEIKDTFRFLQNIFETTVYEFFASTNEEKLEIENDYLKLWELHISELNSQIPDIPYSNMWIASRVSKNIPENSVLHLGILNSLRCWNYFQVPESVRTFSNVGGFGIDGTLSTLLGASLASENKLYFAVLGDLAFFYDMNSLGNRHVGKNLRILLINNGGGTEFKLYSHIGAQFGNKADDFIGAFGHFVDRFAIEKNKISPAQSWSESLGFKYISASCKESFDEKISEFLCAIQERPVIFECFTNSSDESDALQMTEQIGANILESKLKESLPKPVLDGLKSAVKKFK